MTTAPNAPGIDDASKCNAPKVAVVDEAARRQELEQAHPPPSGVLRELALAQWRGSETQVSRPAPRSHAQDR